MRVSSTYFQYQYHSYEHLKTKNAWIRSLYDRVQKICCNQHLFITQASYLKTIISQNGYPNYIRTKTIKLLKNLPIIFWRIPYAGAKGDRLVKNVTKKLKRIISQTFILKNIYKTTKTCYYCNTKDRTPDYLKSMQFKNFPACNASYIGETDQNFCTRITEYYGWDKNSAIFNHLAEFHFYNGTLTLHSSPCDGDVTLTNQDVLGHIRTAVTDNMRIISKSESQTELCLFESLNIKWKKPLINNGIKAAKELTPFA